MALKHRQHKQVSHLIIWQVSDEVEAWVDLFKLAVDHWWLVVTATTLSNKCC